MYKCFIKRLIDIILSILGLILLALPMLVIAIVTKVDTQGPIFITQERVGLHKKIFKILKFRSLPLSAPKDTPTHLLVREHVKLTRWQRFMRKSSIDELPQLVCIFLGHMSLIGPRPALWNQYDLLEERDKYGANDIKPGLTGWAQIHGRDELDIATKAALDGVYTQALTAGRCKGFVMDVKCFWGSILPVLRSEGVADLHGTEEQTISDDTEQG